MHAVAQDAPAPEKAGSATSARRLAPGARRAAVLLVPLVLTLWMGFSRGGYFVGDTAMAAVAGCAALLLWVTLARDPLAGLRLPGAIALAALASLAVWTLVSPAWSGAGARALVEFDRLLLYLTVFALCALLPGTSANVRWLLRGTALVLALLTVAGLLSRLVPDLVDSPAVAQEAERLIWPIGYWNGLGLAAAMAMVLVLHLASDLREHLAVRALAAAVMPALAATLYLTLSRGGFVAAIIGLSLLIALARGPGLPGALLAVAPGAALGLLAAAGADGLTTSYDVDAATSIDSARTLGRQLVLLGALAAAVRLAALPLDRRLDRIVRSPWPLARRAAVAVVLVAGLVIAGLAAGVPGRAGAEWDEFMASAPVKSKGGDRLLAASANGRVEHWQVAWEAFRAEPLRGNGAGTFAHDWAQRRPFEFSVQEAHSLYLEMLSELGVVGLLLLAVALLLPFAVSVRRRREDRVLWSAVVAVTGMFLVRAGIDWDWELPVLTLPVIALLGASCAGAARAPRRLAQARLSRVLAGLAILLLALTPMRAAASQRALDDALAAFRAGDCGTAVDRALDAQSALGTRPEPFELLGYCDVRAGEHRLAERMMRSAVRRDSRSWELHYGLAIVQGAGGKDPRPALRQALDRNPTESVVISAAERMRSANPKVWKREAKKSVVIIPQPTQGDGR